MDSMFDAFTQVNNCLLGVPIDLPQVDRRSLTVTFTLPNCRSVGRWTAARTITHYLQSFMRSFTFFIDGSTSPV